MMNLNQCLMLNTHEIVEIVNYINTSLWKTDFKPTDKLIEIRDDLTHELEKRKDVRYDVKTDLFSVKE